MALTILVRTSKFQKSYIRLKIKKDQKFQSETLMKKVSAEPCMYMYIWRSDDRHVKMYLTLMTAVC